MKVVRSITLVAGFLVAFALPLGATAGGRGGGGFQHGGGTSRWRWLPGQRRLPWRRLLARRQLPWRRRLTARRQLPRRRSLGDPSEPRLLHPPAGPRQQPSARHAAGAARRRGPDLPLRARTRRLPPSRRGPRARRLPSARRQLPERLGLRVLPGLGKLRDHHPRLLRHGSSGLCAAVSSRRRRGACRRSPGRADAPPTWRGSRKGRSPMARASRSRAEAVVRRSMSPVCRATCGGKPTNR